jgi:hypothetical protein
MTYELTIDGNKEKQLLAFLKQLDFVQIKKVQKKTAEKKTEKREVKDPPYFDACPDWDVDVKALREKSTKNRLAGWL